MQTAGARMLREDDNEMSREAVLLQWERKIEVADSRESGRFVRTPAEEKPADEDARTPRDEHARTPRDEHARTPRDEHVRTPRGEHARIPRDEHASAGDEHASAAEHEPADAHTSAADDEPADVALPLGPTEDATARLPRRFERAAERAPAPARPASGRQMAPERRTITITGQPTRPRRRPAMVEAQLAQPDRIALWAFLLGLILVAIAAGTAHA